MGRRVAPAQPKVIIFGGPPRVAATHAGGDDQLSRQNAFSFVREGMPFTVKVPDEVELTLEVEIGDEGTEIEIELSW